jgi:hypothetical protein
MGLYQTKSLYTAKDTVTKLKRQPTEWKKIFASYSADKELLTIESTGSSKNKFL